MFLANFMFLFVGLAGVKVFSMITLVPRTFLWPSVFIFAMIGAYAYRQTSFDVWVMLISGLIGFFALRHGFGPRSEEHTSELQSLMRISYAVFCLKQKTDHEPISTTQK